MAEYRDPKGESGGGVLGEGVASLLPTSYWVWGSAVSSPSWVWGGAPAEIEFGAFLSEIVASGETGDYKLLTLTHW